jgi:secreted trypsin-like serine protease
MRHTRTIVLLIAAALTVAGAARAITFGHLDGNAHPNVGALVANVGPGGSKDFICSGTLISPTVFLTASHCTAYLTSIGIPANEVWVTFDPEFYDGPAPVLHKGTAHTHTGFPGPQSDTHDIAVVVLDAPVVGTAPARLPKLNQLDGIRLKNQRFVAVGYGTVREDKTGGFKHLFVDGKRRWVDQGFLSLTKSWLNLSMNPSTGSGGTCYGDSGGPHFLGTSDVVVSITITGDVPCRATDVTYRTDTASARAFLDDFVAVP